MATQKSVCKSRKKKKIKQHKNKRSKSRRSKQAHMLMVKRDLRRDSDELGQMRAVISIPTATFSYFNLTKLMKDTL